MTKTVLLTLGRFPKGLDIARSFHRLGFRVVVADPARDHLARVSTAVAKSIQVPPPATEPLAYRAALETILIDEAIDLVVPVSEEIMFVSELASTDRAGRAVFSMAPDLIHRMHDKFEFIAFARDLGLAVPATALADTDNAGRLAQSGPFVIKPRHSCAGFGVSLHKAGDAFPADGNRIVQRRMTGAELSTCSVARAGARLATSIYRGTLMNGSVAIAFERIENERVDAWIDRFIAETGWTGFISFDFMLDGNGVPHAIECNPRTTSGLHFFKTDEIAPAILGLADGIGFRSETHLMQFWSCMEELQNGFGNAKRFRVAFSRLVACCDVTWRLTDPLPLLTMPWMARTIISAARRDRVPFGIAATRDLSPG